MKQLFSYNFLFYNTEKLRTAKLPTSPSSSPPHVPLEKMVTDCKCHDAHAALLSFFFSGLSKTLLRQKSSNRWKKSGYSLKEKKVKKKTNNLHHISKSLNPFQKTDNHFSTLKVSFSIQLLKLQMAHFKWHINCSATKFQYKPQATSEKDYQVEKKKVKSLINLL